MKFTKPLNQHTYAEFFGTCLKSSKPAKFNFVSERGNRAVVSFVSGGRHFRFRVIMFAVGSSGRSRPLERRLEITTTYNGNLKELPGYRDVIVGIDRQTHRMVGVDHRRLFEGGITHNASTFVYKPAFEILDTEDIYVLLNGRQKFFDREYQVYFRPDTALRYLMDSEDLHTLGAPQSSGPTSKEKVLKALKDDGNKANQELSFDQQVELALRRMEIGRAGEALVYNAERKKLKKLGKASLANKVVWISQKRPYAGYDILSYDKDGNQRFLEVKSSIGPLKGFHFSANELEQANVRQDSYFVVCVSNIFRKAQTTYLKNPAKMIKKGSLTICSTSYYVTL